MAVPQEQVSIRRAFGRRGNTIRIRRKYSITVRSYCGTVITVPYGHHVNFPPKPQKARNRLVPGFFLDNPTEVGYTIHRKWCYRQTVPPFMCYVEVTAGVESGRLLLFFNDLDDQRDQRDDEHSESKKLGPCNHTDHPLLFRIGGKEDYPRKMGETAYRYW